jgi:hypothetical protein
LRYFASGNGSAVISSPQSDVIFLSELLVNVISHFEIKVAAGLIKNVKGKFESTFEIVIKKLFKETLEAEFKRKALNKTEDNEIVKSKNKQAKEPGSEKKQKAGKDDEPTQPGKKSDQQKAAELLKPAAKEEFPETAELESGIYIENAGLVILAPYIVNFFKNLGYVNGKEFVDDNAKWKAVHLLQWLVRGDEEKGEEKVEVNEHELVLNKIICGLDIAEPVPTVFNLSAEEKKEGEGLLQAVIENWAIIKNSSVHSLRVTFLQKEGKLKRQDENWDLLIHRDSAVETLIDRLPWGISMIKMPWNKATINVEW